MRWTPLRRAKRQTFAVPPIPPNSGYGRIAGSVTVTQDSALRSSAVWAALRLRANLISSMPVDCFRKVDIGTASVQVEMPGPDVVWSSGGLEIDQAEAIYATQFDLDRAGNVLGVITEKNALGLPSRIELVALSDWSLRPRRAAAQVPDLGSVEYVVGGQVLDPGQVWHERQYVVPGLAVGLSPIAYAAYSVGGFLSAQRFALDWFGNSAMPAVTLQNTMREIPPDVAEEAKARYQRSTQPGGVFVVGNDWELKPMNAVAAGDQYIEMMKFGVPDIARFFDVPADLIDGANPSSSITYANIVQRFTHLSVVSVGPAVTRRERAWSKLVPGDRFVKFNRDALLAMDPKTRTEVFVQLATARLRTPDELRALDNLEPLTDADITAMEKVWGGPAKSIGTIIPPPPTEPSTAPAALPVDNSTKGK